MARQRAKMDPKRKKVSVTLQSRRSKRSRSRLRHTVLYKIMYTRVTMWTVCRAILQRTFNPPATVAPHNGIGTGKSPQLP